MFSRVDLYASLKKNEIVVVQCKYTQDTVCFQSSAECEKLNITPLLLGKKVLECLNQCNRISKNYDEIEDDLDEDLLIKSSGLLSLEEFYSCYYPIVVWKDKRSILVGASVSEFFNEKPITLAEPVKAEVVGEEIFKLLRAIEDSRPENTELFND